MEKKGSTLGVRGANKDILGCRFSLAVMSDGYIDQILGAIAKVNTAKIWAQTDALSTTYRGRSVHVLKALQDFFVAANDGKTHITLEALFTGDEVREGETFPAEGKDTLNPVSKSFKVLCKFSFYPLGSLDYKKHIAYGRNLAQERGIFHKNSPYATEVYGDVEVLFTYFSELITYAAYNLDNYALHVTFSINSPTKL